MCLSGMVGNHYRRLRTKTVKMYDSPRTKFEKDLAIFTPSRVEPLGNCRSEIYTVSKVPVIRLQA